MVLSWHNGLATVWRLPYGKARAPGEYIHMGSTISDEAQDFGNRVVEWKSRTGEAMPPADVLLAIVEDMGYRREPPLAGKELSQLIGKELSRQRILKKRRGLFLSCSEILALILGAGYQKSAALAPDKRLGNTDEAVAGGQ